MKCKIYADFVTAYFVCDNDVTSFDIRDTATGSMLYTETVDIRSNTKFMNMQIGFYKLIRQIVIISPVEAVIILNNTNYKKLFLPAALRKAHNSYAGKINKNTQQLILLMQNTTKLRIRIIEIGTSEVACEVKK